MSSLRLKQYKGTMHNEKKASRIFRQSWDCLHGRRISHFDIINIKDIKNIIQYTVDM